MCCTTVDVQQDIDIMLKNIMPMSCCTSTVVQVNTTRSLAGAPCCTTVDLQKNIDIMFKVSTTRNSPGALCYTTVGVLQDIDMTSNCMFVTHVYKYLS